MKRALEHPRPMDRGFRPARPGAWSWVIIALLIALLAGGCGDESTDPANTAPNACFIIDPAHGTTVTDFTFDASCSTDEEDPPELLQVRWDWEGNEVWDTEWSTVKTRIHRFAAPETLTASVQVRDTGGVATNASRTVVVVWQNTSPTACFAGPGVGQLDAVLVFDAGCSADPEDGIEALEVRWDWEDDGSWDTPFDLEKVASHAYSNLGTRVVRLEVRDTRGAAAQATQQVHVTSDTPPPEDFVWIPSGTFLMGSPTSELGRWQNETQHWVMLTRAFYLCKHEVTQSEWESVMGWNESSTRGADLPVQVMTWFDCLQYCNLRSAMDGLDSIYVMTNRAYWGNHIADAVVESPDWTRNGYRLPTEAEWEYACRAGSSTAFTNGPIVDRLCSDPNLDRVGWYCGNAQAPQSVMRKAPNSWGLYDVHGNVLEWCWDALGPYPADLAIDPTGPETGLTRIARGGFWDATAGLCRAAFRSYGSLPTSYIGLRIARTSS